MRGVFLDFDTVSNNDVSTDSLHAVLDELCVHGVTAPEQVAERVAGFDVIMTNKLKITADLLDAAGSPRLINLAATGFNNVDLDACRARDVAVCNITGYCTASVVQHVFTLLLALKQHLQGYQQLLRQGAWRKAPQFTLLDYPVHELAGSTLGIIGYGELGKACAARGEAFGMRVLIAQRPGEPDKRAGRVDLDTLAGEADVISLHCPLNEHTEKLVDEKFLKKMKGTAVLINTARGAVVDEAALADALRGGVIGGAGIDVLSQEPPVNGNPLLAEDIPNLIVTPHIAWAAVEARQRAVEEMAKNIDAFKRGEKRNRVD